jgi:hypothetical protein
MPPTRADLIALAALLCVALLLAPPQELTLQSREARLAAVVQLPPAGRPPYPAVVLVHGSGRLTADSMARPAQRLNGLGLAVLTYDKRGVGRSTGEYSSIGPGNSVRMFDVLAADALAGVEALAARGDIDPRRIGLVGISQGGWIAPLAASRSRRVAFVISISGPAVSVGEEIAYSRLAGADPGSMQGLADEEIARRMQAFRGPHGYDPYPVLEKLTVPSLWVLGEKDRSIPLTRTVDVLNELRTKRERPITLHVIPGVDHGLRNPETGEQPDIWRTVASWLRGRSIV